MPWDYDNSDYDGPPAWWTARQSRAQARRPLCDEDGCPTEDEDSDDTTEDSADEGEE